MPATLGLDVGPNSIGWALVDDRSGRIIGAGSRVFSEGVENFDTAKEVSRNEQRRVARQMRRQHRRRRQRKQELRRALAEVGFLPADHEQQKEFLESDPYPLRMRALNQKLHPYEIGRVFYHLNQRRGFLSLRKKERKDKEVAGMLAKIDSNERERRQAGHETIGSWLAEKHASLDHTQRSENDHVRNRHLSRLQIEEEFDTIWRRQRELGHEYLTDQLKYGATGRQRYPVTPQRIPDTHTTLGAYGIHGLIFFQRPIYWPASAVGRCALEPRHRRCPRADRHAQRFRMLQEVNNLRYLDPDSQKERALDKEQRQLLLEKMAMRREITFDQIRSALGFLQTIRFNLQRGERGKLKGLTTDAILASSSCVGPDWHDLPERDKDRIVRNLLDPNLPDDVVENRLIDRHGLTPQQAEAAVAADLPSGYVDLSLKAIDRLLPHMERGLPVMGENERDSAIHAAGYLRPDQRLEEPLKTLPALDDPASPIPAIPNPVVRRALVELRKVVNNIVREYGLPDRIHVEMAREVKQGEQQRKEHSKRMSQRTVERDQAAEAIREWGEKVTGDKIIRYLLWKEQGQECLYTGRSIGQSQLFGGATDIDHILPRSQSLDNSQMNRVLVFREANREKGQRTVHAWLAGSDPKRYEQVCQRARRLPYPKYRRFLQQEAHLDNFIARQLTDTGYIARATGQYLRGLYKQPHTVLGLKGQQTAVLRRQWGLETILSDLPDSPAWQQEANLRPGEKNRADHRHHALDAIVVALTDRARLQQLARGMRDRKYMDSQTGELIQRRTFHGVIEEPWNRFRDDVRQTMERINVSHRPERKIAGALHQDTFYGPTAEPGVWVVRKPVAELSADEMLHLRDEGDKRAILEHLESHGIEIHRIKSKRGRPKIAFRDVERGKPAITKQVKAALEDSKNPPRKTRKPGRRKTAGAPIRKVRVLRNDLTVRPIREGTQNEAFVRPASTHHLAFFRWRKNGKWKHGVAFTPMLNAIERVKNREEIIQRKPPVNHPHIPGDAEFVFSLSRGEMVLADVKGEEKLLVFRTAASTQGQLYFVEHTDSRRSTAQKKHVFKASTLNARKVIVDPLGRIRWAND